MGLNHVCFCFFFFFIWGRAFQEKGNEYKGSKAPRKMPGVLEQEKVGVAGWLGVAGREGGLQKMKTES